MKPFIILLIGIIFPWVFMYLFTSFILWEWVDFGDWTVNGRLGFFFICLMFSGGTIPMSCVIIETLEEKT